MPREAALGYWSAPDFPFPDRAALFSRLREERTFARAQEVYQYSNLGMAVDPRVVDVVVAELLGLEPLAATA